MSNLLDNAPDMYCHKLARIDVLGPNRRLVFTLPSVDSPGMELVAIKLIVPAELLTELACRAAGADREPDAMLVQLIGSETGRAN